MRKRRRARILAMNAIFQAEVGRQNLELSLKNVLRREKDEEIKKFVRENVRGCWANLDRLDSLLNSLLTGWKPERVQSVDRAIIRLALYEMFYRDDIPPVVVINEAVEIAKQFGDAGSGKFVNGILGAALRKKQEMKITK